VVEQRLLGFDGRLGAEQGDPRPRVRGIEGLRVADA
jgi:hypothetical protein